MATIIWSNFDTWKPIIDKIVENGVCKNTLTRVKELSILGFEGKDIESKFVELKNDIISEIRESLCDEMKNRYVRTFHGCRPENLEVYYEKGLLMPNGNQATKAIESLLKKHPDLLNKNLSLAERIKKTDRECYDGKVFLALDEKGLLKTGSHYMIYGSEWQTSVLGDSAKKKLKKIGIPTIFEIDLQLSNIDEATLKQFVELLFNKWAKLSFYPEGEASWTLFTFICNFDIEPKYIMGHSHPETIVDNHNCNKPYINDKLECPLC